MEEILKNVYIKNNLHWLNIDVLTHKWEEGTAVITVKDAIEAMEELKKSVIKQSPYKWLLNKFSITEGSTYVEPKISLRQCASFITEYQKSHE
jgi:hypothetical protein